MDRAHLIDNLFNLKSVRYDLHLQALTHFTFIMSSVFKATPIAPIRGSCNYMIYGQSTFHSKGATMTSSERNFCNCVEKPEKFRTSTNQ